MHLIKTQKQAYIVKHIFIKDNFIRFKEKIYIDTPIIDISSMKPVTDNFDSFITCSKEHQYKIKDIFIVKIK